MANIIKYIKEFFNNMNKYKVFSTVNEYNNALETNSRNIEALELLIFAEKARIDELTRRIEELESEVLK